MFECNLKFVLVNRPLCPCCLEDLCSDSFVFFDNLAFCPLCVLAPMDRPRTDCLRVFFELLDDRHTACYRRLWFFIPSDRPHHPLQLLETTDGDRHFIRCDLAQDRTEVIDDNPVAGASPV